MDLTPQERRELERLQAKLGAASITSNDRPLSLAQYAKSAAPPLPDNAAYLRTFLEKVEAGIITDFVAVGLSPTQTDLQAAFSHDPSRGKASFNIIGALDVVRALLVRSVLQKEEP